MANVGIGIHRVIQDVDGEAATVTSGKLDVNATLVAGATIDIGDVEITGHSILVSAALNVTDSAAQLTVAACKHVDIMANLSNTGIVYIGSSGVDATKGIALYPGDVYSVDIANLSMLYAMSTVSGDDINVALFT